MTRRRPTTESAGADGTTARLRVNKPEGGQVVGRDARAAELGSDGLQATLEAGPPLSVEHVRSREGTDSGVPAGSR